MVRVRPGIIVTMAVLCLFVWPAYGTSYSPGFVPACPEGFATVHGQDFDICYGPGSAGDVSAVANEASRAYAEASAFFRGVPFHPRIIIASSQEEYESILGSGSLPDYSMSSGWGDGSDSAIVIKRPGLVPDFHIALTHEMAHIATRSYIQGYKYALPEWLSEGIAVYVSGDTAWNSVIEDKCRNGELMSIDDLDRVHTLSATDEVSEDEVGTAYAQAGMLVEYIENKYGEGTLLAMLDRFGPAGDLDAVFVEAFGETPEGVNLQWQKELKAELDRRDGKILEQTVSGYVVDHHGAPMPNETVSFIALRNDSPVQGTVYTAVTNETGQYSVMVTYGDLHVISEKPDYEGFEETITLSRKQSLFLNVTLNGTALEARQKAERDRDNMIYAGLGTLTLLGMGTVLAVFVRSRKKVL